MKRLRKHKTERDGPTRRGFIQATAAMGICAATTPRVLGQAVGANDRVGVGVIGVGHRATGAHFLVFDELNRGNKKVVEVTAVCDVYRPRLERAAKRCGAKAYMDHRELIQDRRVDVVCIASPDRHHCRQAIDAVRAGKDVYCEKPLSHWRQFEIAKQLVEEVKRSNRVFQLGTDGMSDSAWRQMKELVKDGLIGRPVHAECGYFRVGDRGYHDMKVDDPNAKPGKDLDWEAFLGDAPRQPFDVNRFFRWRLYEDYSGGPATDLFPHSLTPVVNVLGVTMPSMVVATGGIFRYSAREVPDTFNMLIDYPENLTVAVLGTGGNSYPGYGGHRGKGHRVPTIRGWDGTLTIKGNEIIFTPVHGCKKSPRSFPIERGESLAFFWRSFLENCRLRRPQTLSPIDLAHHVQTALTMGMLGLRQQKVARFDGATQRIVLD